MNFLKHIFLLLSLFLIITVARSQSLSKIEGYVYNQTGLPIVGANISVIGTGYGAATDYRGYFSIENLFAGEYQIQISHVSFKSEIRSNIVVEKDVPSTLQIKLTPYISTTEDIVIEADLNPDASSTIRINITPQQIKKSSARSLGELLTQVPGISIIDEGGGSGQKRISIRGSNPNQILVLLDGIPLNDPLTGEVDLNLIPVSIIESVAIQKGGNSAESGSGSIGGSVEITSKQDYQNKISLSMNSGSFGALSIQPSLSGKAYQLNYYVSYEYRTEDGDFPYTYQKPDGEIISDTRLNAGFKSQQFFAKLGFNNDNHDASIQLNHFDSQRGLPGTIYFLTPYATADVERSILSGNYIYQADILRIGLQLSAHKNHSEYINEWPPDPPLKYRKVPPYHTKYQVNAYQAKSEADIKWMTNNKASLKLSYRRDIFTDQNILIPQIDPGSETDNRQLGISLANQCDFPKPEWLHSAQLKVAARYDLINFSNPSGDRRDEFFSPKIGILLGHQDEWLINIQANAGRSFRAPTFGDLYYQDFRVRGNADLLPEKSMDYDAGITVGLPWLNQPEFSATYFRQNIENLIVWELGSFATWQPTNLDAFIDGWEYTFRWQLWPQYLSMHIDHTFLNARDRSGRHTTNDKFLIYRPRNTTKMTVELKIDQIDIQYYKRFVGERYVTPSNTVSLPGHTVDDISIRALFIWEDFDIAVKMMILNIFDTRYEIVEHAPIPGRNWRVGVEIKY
jgi:outer membrane cobalamin receptor